MMSRPRQRAGHVAGARRECVTNNRGFDGAIDSVAVWNRALSASEVLARVTHALAGNEANLVSYWSFNEPSGQTVFDAAVGRVSGDANRLQQVVWNLLSNAVKFSPAGGRVEVTLERVMDNSPWPWSALPSRGSSPAPSAQAAQIKVTDGGQGIAH